MGKRSFLSHDGLGVCYPQNGLIQYFDGRNNQQFTDYIDGNNADLTESYALEFDREKLNGIKTKVNISGGTEISASFGVKFYNFDPRGSVVISNTTPGGGIGDKGFALITGGGAGITQTNLNLQVFNGSGSVNFDSVTFPTFTFVANTYYEVEEFYWDGQNGDGSNTYIQVDGVKHYGNTSITHSWSGPASHNLHIGIFEDVNNQPNNYNLHGYLTHLEVGVNGTPKNGGSISVGYGDLIYSQTNGNIHWARNVEAMQWIKQNDYHKNIDGCTIANQLYFDNGSTNPCFIRLNQINIPNLQDFKVKIRTKLSNNGEDTQVVWAQDYTNLPNKTEFRVHIQTDGRVYLHINNGTATTKVIFLSVGAYEWDTWNNIVVWAADDNRIYLGIKNGGPWEQIYTTWDTEGSMVITGSDAAYVGFDKGGYDSGDSGKRAIGEITKITQYAHWEDDDIVNVPPTYELFINDITHEAYGSPAVVENTLLNDDETKGKYYIPVYDASGKTDVHGGVATNPIVIDGHNGCETCVKQPVVQALVDADTDKVWFGTGDLTFSGASDNVVTYDNVSVDPSYFEYRVTFRTNDGSSEQFLVHQYEDPQNNNKMLIRDGKVQVYTYGFGGLVIFLESAVINFNPNTRYKATCYANATEVTLNIYTISETGNETLIDSKTTTYTTNGSEYDGPLYLGNNEDGDKNFNGEIYDFTYINHTSGHNVVVEIGSSVVDSGYHDYASYQLDSLPNIGKDVAHQDLPLNIGNYAFGDKSTTHWRYGLLYNPPLIINSVNRVFKCYGEKEGGIGVVLDIYGNYVIDNNGYVVIG